MPSSSTFSPTTFYLNEQHELSRGEREGGGRFAQYHGIDWAAKGQHIKATLESVRAVITASDDPLRDLHYFVLARPVANVQKQSTNKRLAPEGILTESIHFDESD